jgi:hypothetical protein
LRRARTVGSSVGGGEVADGAIFAFVVMRRCRYGVGRIYLGRRNLAFGGVEIPSRCSRSLLVEIQLPKFFNQGESGLLIEFGSLRV